MPFRTLIVASLLVGSISGCRLAKTVAFTTVHEPLQLAADVHTTQKARRLAADALGLHCARRPLHRFHEDYQTGFIDGYADHLVYGGQPAPPAFPPVRYRRKKFLEPEGVAGIEDYTTGFYNGALAAAESGQRQIFVLPLVIPDPNANVFQPPDPPKSDKDEAKAKEPAKKEPPKDTMPMVDPAPKLPPQNPNPVEPALADPPPRKIDPPPVDKPILPKVNPVEEPELKPAGFAEEPPRKPELRGVPVGNWEPLPPSPHKPKVVSKPAREED